MFGNARILRTPGIRSGTTGIGSQDGTTEDKRAPAILGTKSHKVGQVVDLLSLYLLIAEVQAGL